MYFYYCYFTHLQVVARAVDINTKYMAMSSQQGLEDNWFLKQLTVVIFSFKGSTKFAYANLIELHQSSLFSNSLMLHSLLWYNCDLYIWTCILFAILAKMLRRNQTLQFFLKKKLFSSRKIHYSRPQTDFKVKQNSLYKIDPLLKRWKQFSKSSC